MASDVNATPENDLRDLRIDDGLRDVRLKAALRPDQLVSRRQHSGRENQLAILHKHSRQPASQLVMNHLPVRHRIRMTHLTFHLVLPGLVHLGVLSKPTFVVLLLLN